MAKYKNSSIYDLTDDQKLIDSVIGFPTDKKSYLALVSEQARVCDMLSFAEMTENKSLIEALKKEFADQLVSWFNE